MYQCNEHDVVEENDSDSDYYINSVDTCSKIANDQAFVHVTLGNTDVKFKVDTGSQVNILPQSMYQGYFSAHYASGKSKIRNLFVYNVTLCHYLVV